MNTPSRHRHTGKIDLDLSAPERTEADQMLLLGLTGARLDIELKKTGKQQGTLSVPVNQHAGGPYQHRLPVCSIKGRQPGPAICLMAGVHGDEAEGSLIINRLIRELTEDDVHGRLILLPAINTHGLKTGTRCNPLDGQNIDYAFPGDCHGSASEQLAYEITRHFIEPSDLIIDLRSGGRGLRFVPSVAVRFNDDAAKQSLNENAMIAFGAPNSLRLPASSQQSCLQSVASSMNKQYLQTELGGGDTYDAKTLSIAYQGCLNVLRHSGMLMSDLELASTRLLEVRNETYYVYAPGDGVYEPLTYLGEPVWLDEPMAHIVRLDGKANPLDKVHPPHNAILIAAHPGGFVNEGELIAILAEQVQA